VTVNYPEPLPGNPRQFTIDQHVFPVESLRRFADQDGLLMVRRNDPQRVLKLRPTNVMFCAKRAWDERTEKGLMKQIEDRFQQLAGEILDGRRSLGPAECSVASRFYALCRVRSQHRASPTPDARSPLIKGDTLTLEQQENLEKNGYVFMTENGLPGRMMAGILILRHIDFFEHELNAIPWGIVTSAQGEFVIPDEFGTTPIVPVTPTLCLVAAWEDSILDRSGVRDVNEQLTSAVRHYLVAHDLPNCPL
jgi:hypothetical protein